MWFIDFMAFLFGKSLCGLCLEWNPSINKSRVGEWIVFVNAQRTPGCRYRRGCFCPRLACGKQTCCLTKQPPQFFQASLQSIVKCMCIKRRLPSYNPSTLLCSPINKSLILHFPKGRFYWNVFWSLHCAPVYFRYTFKDDGSPVLPCWATQKDKNGEFERVTVSHKLKTHNLIC